MRTVGAQTGVVALRQVVAVPAADGRQSPLAHSPGPPSPPLARVVESEDAEAAVATSLRGRRPLVRLGAGVVEGIRQLSPVYTRDFFGLKSPYSVSRVR